MGVDAISHLKCNSIRELHRFHQETGQPEQRAAAVRDREPVSK